MISKDILFYLIIIISVISVRLGVFLIPEVDVMFAGHVIHHFAFGILLMFISFFLPKQNPIRLFGMGIGLGLLLDQIVFMALGGGKDAEYWSFWSNTGTIMLLVVLLPLRKKVYNIFA